jgi:hypothetical protein
VAPIIVGFLVNFSILVKNIMIHISDLSKFTASVTALISLSWIPLVLSGQKGELKFTHFYVDMPLEPSSYGTGGFSVNDYDNDGDMDITIQRRTLAMKNGKNTRLPMVFSISSDQQLLMSTGMVRPTW